MVGVLYKKIKSKQMPILNEINSNQNNLYYEEE